MKFSKKIFSEEEIQNKLAEVAKQINADYKGKQKDGVFLVGILNGAYMFFSDLSKLLDFDFQVQFIRTSSYKNALKSSGVVQINFDMTRHVEGKHIIIVEDIIDTGKTIAALKNEFEQGKARSIKVCSFLVKDNPERSEDADYFCFKCPDEFIVGYGLDYKQMHRDLPYVSSLDYQVKE